MNRQLYQMGGIGSLMKEQQAQQQAQQQTQQQAQLKKEQAQQQAEQIQKAYRELVKRGLSEDQARQSIEQQLSQLRENNLLQPGEYAGEGYKGTPDMYPDYEIDSQENNNREMRQMGGMGGMEQSPQEMQMAPQEMQQNQEQPQMDPNQAIELLVKMLMEQGIPQEEAVKIAMQMIQAVAEGGMQEVSDDSRVEARFGGRMGYASGGIGRLVDREQYGFGSFFKGITKGISGVVKGVTSAVKKVASSDLGKIALMAAAVYAGGGGALFGGPGFSIAGTAGSSAGGLLGAGGQFSLGNSYLGQQLLGTQVVNGIGNEGLLGKMGLGRGYGASVIPSGISSLIPGKGSLISAGAGLLSGSLAGGMQSPQQEPGESMEQYQARVAEFEKQYGSNLAGRTGPSLSASARNSFYPVYAAQGGRIGYQEGGMGNVITQATQEAFFGQPQIPMMANGGRMRYAYGNSVQEGIMAAPQIANQMGMPVGNPRQNQSGVSELDYREEGGFVPPIGIKEKEDDIPAMLSNNEFVFTADAVKNADPEKKQDPERGARVMYTLMKRLESGGMA